MRNKFLMNFSARGAILIGNEDCRFITAKLRHFSAAEAPQMFFETLHFPG
jgi:hypothetical protein